MRCRILLIVPLLLALAPAAAASDDPRIQAAGDAAMASVLRDRGVPGGVLAIVKDGRVLVAKGYGLADRNRNVPMDPRMTRLPAASISKVVSATAVMQLVQQGRIDLDRPVNDYLEGFAVPSRDGEPVRVRHLLTHTAGFDENFVGLMVPAGQPPQLARALATHQPPLIARPGTSLLYSNYGTSLAGHIVETVAGEPFATHVARALFEPLGMRSSSFELPPDRTPNLATGYTGDPAVTPWSPPLIHLVPAAGLTTTGEDMAKFLLAHLEGGPAEGSTPVLAAKTLQTMHTRQFSADPRLGGVAYGFFEQFHNGVRTLMHDGDWTGYSHRLVLIPEHRLGIFVSLNAWRAEARAEVVHRIVQAVLPPAPPPSTPAAVEASAHELAGTYWWNRYPHRGLLKWMGSKMETVITAVDDRTLDVGGVRFLARAPDFFRRADGNGAIVHAADGRVLLEMPIHMGPLVLERIPWYGTGRVQQGLRLPLIAVCATSLIWPIGLVVRRIRRRPRPASGSAPARARLLATIAALAVVVSPVWFAQVTRRLMYETSTASQALLLVPPATALVGVAVAVCAILAWRRRFWTLAGRLHYSVVAAAIVIYVLVLGYWNLLRIPGWPI